MKAFTQRCQTSFDREATLKRNRRDVLKNPVKQFTGWAASRSHGKRQKIYWAACPTASTQERQTDGLWRKGLPLSTSAAQLLPLRGLRSQTIHLSGIDAWPDVLYQRADRDVPFKSQTDQGLINALIQPCDWLWKHRRCQTTTLSN